MAELAPMLIVLGYGTGDISSSFVQDDKQRLQWSQSTLFISLFFIPRIFIFFVSFSSFYPVHFGIFHTVFFIRSSSFLHVVHTLLCRVYFTISCVLYNVVSTRYVVLTLQYLACFYHFVHNLLYFVVRKLRPSLFGHSHLYVSLSCCCGFVVIHAPSTKISFFSGNKSSHLSHPKFIHHVIYKTTIIRHSILLRQSGHDDDGG
jgi:hypothetical protein